MSTSPAHSRWALVLLAIALGATRLAGAADQATKNRCTAYAQRAVQDYQQMKAHSQCWQNTDPLNWQDNYDNHYNGCLILPEKMTKAIEEGRQNHLQACGALSEASSGASGAQASGGGAAPAGSSGAAPATAAQPAAAAPQGASASPGGSAANDPECHSAGPGGYTGIPGTGEMGTQGAMAGNVLSFIDGKTGKRVSYAVVRPHFVVVQIHCTGKPSDNTGMWVWASPDGKSGKQIAFDGTGRVLTVDVTGAVARKMILGQ